MQQPLVLALVLVASSVLSVLAALLLAAALERRGGRGRRRAAPASGAAVFLLCDGAITDASESGRALLATLRAQAGPQGGDGWALLTRLLAARFPGALERLAQPGTERWEMGAADGSAQRLLVQPLEGAVRIVLAETGDEGEAIVPVDRLSWRALSDELTLLRRINDTLPAPAWRLDAGGQIVWANGAYLRLLAEAGRSAPLTWPLPHLFPPEAAERGGRNGLTLGNGRMRWFDLDVRDEDGGRLICALPADEAQKAERARREFVQTLSKTFATLTIGLAVFDRTRRLQLFNPAMIDLTGLEPEFLASRPGLEGFLNRMRDKHILPEPRDYRAWSRRLLEVEIAAQGVGFEETWALADGRSFRVSVAPHPDGALAFLIEDVTSEIRLKRGFRAEIDMMRAALDMSGDAVAVFAPGGELVLTNAAFDRAWTLEGADTLAGVRLSEAIANWREAGGESGLWDRVAALARPGAGEGLVTGQVDVGGGEILTLCARSGPGGTVLLAFSGFGQNGGPAATAAARPEAGWARSRVASA